MEKRIAKLLLFLLSAILTACAPVVVNALHEPFHPSGSDRVKFVAEAQAVRGIAEISIFQRTFLKSGFCAGYVAGQCRPLPTPGLKTIRKCTFGDAPRVARCEAEVAPFADGTFVTYGATAKDSAGLAGEDSWIGFAVGTQADPNEPVPVYTRGSSGSSIDVVLIPVDYNGIPGRTYRDFMSDARRLVADGFLAHADITNNRSKWNFYVNPVTGGLLQSTIGTVVTRSTTPPANWPRIAALADTAAYVHHDTAWRDFATFNDAGTSQFTIDASTPGVIVHETGHAVFGLSDEYCCDGGTVQTAWPHSNLFDNLATCQLSANDHSVATAACIQVTALNGPCGGLDKKGKPVLGTTNLKWRMDVAGDMMGCGGSAGADGGLLDSARIYWYYTQHLNK